MLGFSALAVEPLASFSSGYVFSGASDVVLDSLSLTATGSADVAGSASIALGALSLTSIAEVRNLTTGSLGVELAAITLSSETSLSIAAGVEVVLGQLVATSAFTLETIIYYSFTASLKNLALTSLIKNLTIQVNSKSLSLRVDEGEPMQKLPTKMPNEIWHCTYELAPWIPSGVTAGSIAIVRLAGDVLVDNVILADADTATFKVSGGSVHTDNLFQVNLSLSNGDIKSEQFSILVE